MQNNTSRFWWFWVMVLLIASVLLFVYIGTSSGAEITIRWDPNTEPDLAHYNIYRTHEPDGPWRLLDPTTCTLALKVRDDGTTSQTLSIAATSGPTTGSLVAAPAYTDLTALAGTLYWYRVTALDTSGNESGPSNRVGRLAKDGAPPGDPTRLR